MTVCNKRVLVKKKRRTNFGRRLAHVKTSRDSATISIHQEILCNSSPFFRRKLQPGRHAIEGDCPICHEEMNQDTQALTYCELCGGNLHYPCIQRYAAPITRALGTVLCPLCWQRWKTVLHEQMFDFPELDQTGLEIYSEWLYTGCIASTASIESIRGEIDLYEDLFVAYFFETHVEDVTFCNAVIEAIIEARCDSHIFPNAEYVDLVYKKTKHPASLRKLMVEIYMHLNAEDESWRTDPAWWEGLPPELMRNIAMAALSKNPSQAELLQVDTLKAKMGLGQETNSDGDDDEEQEEDGDED